MEFIQYFGNVFEPYNFAILVLGTIGGLLLGATPGLSPTMTVALLIPFTFHMSSIDSTRSCLTSSLQISTSAHFCFITRWWNFRGFCFDFLHPSSSKNSLGFFSLLLLH